jgi:hypothetical protein
MSAAPSLPKPPSSYLEERRVAEGYYVKVTETDAGDEAARPAARDMRSYSAADAEAAARKQLGSLRYQDPCTLLTALLAKFVPPGMPFGGSVHYGSGVKYVGQLKQSQCCGQPVPHGKGMLLFPPLGSGDTLEGTWSNDSPSGIMMASKFAYLWVKNFPSLVTS